MHVEIDVRRVQYFMSCLCMYLCMCKTSVMYLWKHVHVNVCLQSFAQVFCLFRNAKSVQNSSLAVSLDPTSQMQQRLIRPQAWKVIPLLDVLLPGSFGSLRALQRTRCKRWAHTSAMGKKCHRLHVIDITWPNLLMDTKKVMEKWLHARLTLCTCIGMCMCVCVCLSARGVCPCLNHSKGIRKSETFSNSKLPCNRCGQGIGRR